MPKNGRSGLPASTDAVTLAMVATSRCPTYSFHITVHMPSTQASIAAECDGSMRLVLRKENGALRILDTPPPKSGRFSVLCRSLRHGSPKALPKPLYILRGVVV